MAAEKQLENQIKHELERRKIWYFKVAASEEMPPGIPDIIACIFGRFVGIEVKAPGKKHNTSNAQKVQLMLIERSYGVAWVIDDYEEFLYKLDELQRSSVQWLK